MMLKAVANGCATADDLRERGSVYITYLTDAVRNGDLIRKEGEHRFPEYQEWCEVNYPNFVKKLNNGGEK